MSLRNRLLALSLLTLLLPWSGWVLLQELEGFLRTAQEYALSSTARTLAAALPFEAQSKLLFAPERYLVTRPLERSPALDGFSDDWPEAQQGLELAAGDGQLQLRLLAGSDATGLFLFFDVTRAAEPGQMGRGSRRTATLELLLRSPRGLLRFQVQPEAPGPVQLHSEGGGGQAEGYWLETERGFRVELALPAFALDSVIGFEIQEESYPRNGGGGQVNRQRVGTRGPAGIEQWVALVSEWPEVSALLADAVPTDVRAWLLNRDGWVLADSGVAEAPAGQQTTWLQRLLYRAVAGGRTRIEPATGERPLRFQGEASTQALAGTEGRTWSQDPDTAVVRNTVAVPVLIEGQARGAVVLQSASEGLLLVTNRALGRLLLTTLVITFGLAGGLWFFATRLSRRVLRLSGAVSEAMQDGVVAGVLPLTADRDELGELARNNAKLLRAVADYNQYLQTLAGKLSHELKTPLAITRSSLENLSSRPLDQDAQRFLLRAQEGLDRQAAIVRAMSESSRLEASIRAAEWEEIDVGRLVMTCADGYRAVHPQRRIETRTPGFPLRMVCAPELLAQALDKLVENAISLSANDHVVTIALSRTTGALELAVRNQGSRLPEAFQDRLFDSLVSVRDKPDSTPHLGLGLYIVRLVAEAHQGWVRARNLADDQGVEFVMHLPTGGPGGEDNR